MNNLNTNKLNVSAKATQADAISGTDNTKYITSYALAGKIKRLNATGSSTSISSTPKTDEFFDFTAYPNKTILITGTMRVGASASGNFATFSIYNGTTGITIKDIRTTSESAFFIQIDTKYGLVKINELTGSEVTTLTTIDTKALKLNNLQKLRMYYNGTATTYDFTFEILD